MAQDHRLPADLEIMAFGLDLHGVDDGLAQRLTR